jgi:hypothetical protein
MIHKKITLLSLIFFLLLIGHTSVRGQNSMPEVLNNGTLKQQLDYLNEKTRIYNGFRAVRDDMFLKMLTNSNDSLVAAKIDIIQLQVQLQALNDSINELQADLNNTNDKLEQAIINRDRLKFIGIPVHKSLYNSIMWIVIAALAVLSVILFLSAKRNFSVSKHLKKDLEEVKEEFEAYRKQTRERQEQLVVKHHNELKKMRGK